MAVQAWLIQTYHHHNDLQTSLVHSDTAQEQHMCLCFYMEDCKQLHVERVH